MTIAEHIQQTLETKRIPAALVAAFLFQTAGVVYWAGTAAERISVLERTVARNQSAIDQVAVIASDLKTIRTQLARIEAKLDRLQERQTPTNALSVMAREMFRPDTSVTGVRGHG